MGTMTGEKTKKNRAPNTVDEKEKRKLPCGTVTNKNTHKQNTVFIDESENEG